MPQTPRPELPRAVAGTCLIVVGVAAALLALLGILLFPALSFVWALIAVAIGGVVSIWLHVVRPGTGTAVRIGALVTAVTAALGHTVAGSVVLIGVATAWVVPLLLGVGGLLGWRYRRSWISAVASLVPATPPAAASTSVVPVDVPARGRPVEEQRGAPAVPPVLAQLSSLNPDAVSTSQLCGAWQHSYWLLLDLPPGPSHDEVVRLRRLLLDELERRDPTGFRRWLHTAPRAGGHPGQYLIVDRPSG